MAPRINRWLPSEEQLAQAEMLSGYFLSEEKIAHFFGVSLSVLQRAKKTKGCALQERLLKGRSKSDAKLGESLYQMATSKKHPAINIFLAKVRLRMKEEPDESKKNSAGVVVEEGSQVIINIPSNGR